MNTVKYWSSLVIQTKSILKKVTPCLNILLTVSLLLSLKGNCHSYEKVNKSVNIIIFIAILNQY